MTRVEAFKKIKELFGMEDPSTAKLKDGNIIQWTGELAEGAALNSVDTDGNVLPIVDGEYEMEDGTKITCVGGLVTMLAGPKVEKEVEPVEEMSEFEKALMKHLEDFAAFTEKFTALENKVTEYEAKFTQITEATAATDSSISEKFAKVVELVETISKEPAVGQPKPPNAFQKREGENTRINKFLEFQKSINFKP